MKKNLIGTYMHLNIHVHYSLFYAPKWAGYDFFWPRKTIIKIMITKSINQMQTENEIHNPELG